MAKLYERRWWQKLFLKPEHVPKVDVLKDLEAIRECLDGLKDDTKAIIKKIDTLEELEKEREVARESIVIVNLQAQGKVFDQLIDEYEVLQNDIDINGLRLKMICKEYLKHAQKAGMHQLVEEKKRSDRWKFQW